MSYGQEFKIDGDIYLIEKSDAHIYVAKKIKEGYNQIFQGDYSSVFWREEMLELNKLDYDAALYAMLLKTLDYKGLVDCMASYQKYLYGMLESGHAKEEILESASDERFIYALYFPLDTGFSRFKELSTSIIDGWK
jgi:hypothetical protein